MKAVINEKFEEVKLSDYSGEYLVLLFYPFDFTFVCPTELISFSDSIPQFDEINTKILGISADSLHSHLAWVRTSRSAGGIGKLNYPLVADFNKKFSADYGVLVTDPEDDLVGAPLRGLYIIDGKGVIRHAAVNDAPVGRSVDETIRLLKGF
jgi:alkyl hydroperoxide reductase subunit AhpC